MCKIQFYENNVFILAQLYIYMCLFSCEKKTKLINTFLKINSYILGVMKSFTRTVSIIITNDKDTCIINNIILGQVHNFFMKI